MSTKPVFEKTAKIQRSYVPFCGHKTFVLLMPARTVTIIDIIRKFCNDVNKTNTSIELLTINKSMAGLKTSVEEWNGHKLLKNLDVY